MGEPSPHRTTSAAPCSRAVTHLRIIAGMTWEVLQIEVVARAVQVHREQHDAVEAVLRAVGLRLHQQQLLGDAVGGVGLLGVAVPEIVLLERAPARTSGRRRWSRRPPACPRPARRHSSSSCRPIMALSNRNRPGWSRLAPMPPTRAARWNTSCGPGVGQQPLAGRAVDQVVVAAARHERGRCTPRARRASTTKLPRKPAPPVTTTRLPARGDGLMGELSCTERG